MKRAIKAVVGVVSAVILCAGIITSLEGIRQASFKISQEIQKSMSVR